MFIQHIAGFLYHPNLEWKLLRKERSVSFELYLMHMAGLALIPSGSLFIGTTQIGWSVAGGDFVKLHPVSAINAAIAFYFAMIIAVTLVTYSIYWMERTYGGKASANDCLNLATYTAVPLFLSGFAGLYPLLWFNVAVVMFAMSYSIYLLYKGVEVVMQIPQERAFVFATSILTVGLCILIGLITVTVIFWSTNMPLNFIR